MSASKDYFKKAEQAAKKQNFDYSIELYMQGLMIDPKSTAQRRKMHKVMTLAIEEKGGNPQGGLTVKLKVMPILANVKKLTMQKKWDESVIEYEKALRYQPRNCATLFALAGVLENNECSDSAIGILEDVVTIDKGHIEAYRRLGKLWADDDPEKAISYWERLKQHKPDDKEAGKAIRDLSAATMVKKAEERKAAAGDESFKAMLADEDKSSELEKKGKIIRTDADRVEAIKYKTEDLKKDPKNSRLWRDLGGLYQDLKKWVRAEQAYKKALQVNPHDLFASEKIGALKENRLEAEVDELRKAASANGSSEEQQQQLEVKEKAFTEFKVVEYERRVKAHPTDYELKMRYGRVLMDNSNFDAAIEQFQKAIQDPKYKVVALTCNGTCFFEKGLLDLANAQYQTALGEVSSDPNSEVVKEIKYHLGHVCEAKARQAADGDRKPFVDEALKWYQEIMAVHIGYRDVSGRVTGLMAGQIPDA